MNGICKLCGNEKDLMGSHIFPKFIFRWMKRTGGPYFRFGKDPNRRVQDGPTKHWLCSSCEELFSQYESYFSTQVFVPIVDEKRRNVPYDERLTKFLISLLWRVLLLDIEDLEKSKDPYLPEVYQAEQDWRDYLLKGKPLEQFCQTHVFIYDEAIETPPGVEEFNRYCLRAIDGVVITDQIPRFVYAKFSRFVCVNILSPYDESEWVGTKINKVGTLSQPQSILNQTFGETVMARVRLLSEKFQFSDNQKQVIARSFYKHQSSVITSDLWAAVMADVEAGKRHQEWEKTIGRNDLCPCGSNIKFKKCHGKQMC